MIMYCIVALKNDIYTQNQMEQKDTIATKQIKV